MASTLIAFAIALIWCALAAWAGPRLGFVDRPERSELTAHATPAVPLGGVGIYLAINAAMLWRGELDPALLVASSIVLVLGIVDDRMELSPVLRLGIEIIAAVTLVSLASYHVTGVPFAVLAVVTVVVAINAVNLYDGLDGLAGLSAFVMALGLAWLLTGRGFDGLAAVELAAALAGFLILNWHPARVFLGDGGSYVAGLVLAHFVLSSGDSSGEVVLAMGLFGVFAVDLVASVTRRMLAGEPLFQGDRRHLYDQLRQRGLSVPSVALASAGAEAAWVVIVILLDLAMSPWIGVALLAVIMAAVLAGLGRAGFLSAPEGLPPVP